MSTARLYFVLARCMTRSERSDNAMSQASELSHKVLPARTCGDVDLRGLYVKGRSPTFRCGSVASSLERRDRGAVFRVTSRAAFCSGWEVDVAAAEPGLEVSRPEARRARLFPHRCGTILSLPTFA